LTEHSNTQISPTDDVTARCDDVTDAMVAVNSVTSETEWTNEECDMCEVEDEGYSTVHESIVKLPVTSQYSIALARTERFKRSFVLYALHSFPTDIYEDFCDDFIHS